MTLLGLRRPTKGSRRPPGGDVRSQTTAKPENCGGSFGRSPYRRAKTLQVGREGRL